MKKIVLLLSAVLTAATAAAHKNVRGTPAPASGRLAASVPVGLPAMRVNLETGQIPPHHNIPSAIMHPRSLAALAVQTTPGPQSPASQPTAPLAQQVTVAAPAATLVSPEALAAAAKALSHGAAQGQIVFDGAASAKAGDSALESILARSRWLGQGRNPQTALAHFDGRYQVRRNQLFTWQTAAPHDGYTVGFKAAHGEIKIVDIQPTGDGRLNWKLSIVKGRYPSITLQVHKNGVLKAAVKERFEALTWTQQALRIAWMLPLGLMIPISAFAVFAAAYLAGFMAGNAAVFALFGPQAAGVAAVVGWVAGGALGFCAFGGVAVVWSAAADFIFKPSFWRKASVVLVPALMTAGVYAGLPVLIPQLLEAQAGAAALFKAMVAVVAGWAAYHGQRALVSEGLGAARALRGERGSGTAWDMVAVLGIVIALAGLIFGDWFAMSAGSLFIPLSLLAKNI